MEKKIIFFHSFFDLIVFFLETFNKRCFVLEWTMSKQNSKSSFSIDDILCQNTTPSVTIPNMATIDNRHDHNNYTAAIPNLSGFIPPGYYFSNPGHSQLAHVTYIDQYYNAFQKGKIVRNV